MATHHKFEDLAERIRITVEEEEDTEIDTSDIYYKLIQVDLHQPDPIAFLEQQVNKFIENASDDFLPSGQPFVVDNVAKQSLVQMLVDVDNM